MDEFSEWLTESQAIRDALFAHSKSKIPNEKGLLDADIEKSIRAAEVSGAQLAVVKYHLTGAMADAFKDMQVNHPDVKGVGRDILIKDRVREIELLHDQIENLARSLNSRVKSECNCRRSLL